MAGRKVIWTARAKQELQAVLNYWLERNGTATYSRKVAQLVKKNEHLIRQFPQIGRPSEKENVRGRPILYYLLIYKIKPDRIEILSFFDTRMDPAKLENVLR